MQKRRQEEMPMDRNQKKKYKTWDEAFRGLIPAVRQQSVRTAEYTQAMFHVACSSETLQQIEEAAPYLKEEYEDVAYRCGLYAQIGKAMLPPEVQVMNADFSREEMDLYHSYPTEGEALAARLQGEGGKDGEISIPCQMIRKACLDHMEKWNGYGYPNGKRGEEISLIGQIVGIAKEVDRLTTQTPSEDPFEDAIEVLLSGKDVFFGAAALKLLKDSKADLRTVYKKYIQYTQTFPKTVPLIDKRPDRPFGLKYLLPVPEGEDGGQMIEARAWYRENAKAEPMAEEDAIAFMQRTGIYEDVMRYLCYEAADTIARLENCGRKERVCLPMNGIFYEDDPRSLLEQLWKDTGIDSRRLVFAVPESAVSRADLEMIQKLTEYIEEGIQLLLDDYDPSRMSLKRILEIGFTLVRPATEITESEEWQQKKAEFASHGITVLEHSTSDIFFSEEELIKDLLLGEA